MQPSKKCQADEKGQTGRWSKQQHGRFMLGLMTYGKDWKKIQQLVATRTTSQVRSHAQKFFIKLQKQQKKANQKKKQNFLHVPETPKKIHESEFEQISGSQYQISKNPNDQFSDLIPNGLFPLIQNQPAIQKKISIQDFQKQLSQKIKDHQIQNLEKDGESYNRTKLLKTNSFKSMNNMLSAFQNLFQDNNSQKLSNMQDESFFIRLAKNHRKYFLKGGHFQNLIDFGQQKPKNIIIIEPKERKKSFTLPQGIQGNQQDLKERKKRIVSQSQTVNITQQQKDSFNSKMTSISKSSQQKTQNKQAQSLNISQ